VPPGFFLPSDFFYPADRSGDVGPSQAGIASLLAILVPNISLKRRPPPTAAAAAGGDIKGTEEMGVAETKEDGESRV
jgi:hypothetical protein